MMYRTVIAAALLICTQLFWAVADSGRSQCPDVHPSHCTDLENVIITYNIESPNGNLKMSNLEVEKGSSFFDAMIVAANRDKRFQFSGDYYGGNLRGFFITKINGTAQNKQKNNYWMFYIGNTLSSCGVSTTEVEDGAEYTFKYMIPSF